MNFYIVTPSYNQGNFIEETISSILSQKHSGKTDYFVADAKSTDKTKSILRKNKGKLRYRSAKDAGQADAINKGITALQLKTKRKGIFAYINSDDYYLPDTFRKVSKAFAQNPKAQWLVGDCLIVDSKGKEIQKAIRLYKQLWRYLPLSLLLPVLNPIPQPAVFFRVPAIKRLGFFNKNLRYTMDYEYWLRALETLGEPIRLDNPLAAFRIHGSSKGGSEFTKQFSEELSVARSFTKNRVQIILHELHNKLITMIYKVIK